VVLCSTGLDVPTRHAVMTAAAGLDGVAWHGDLTDRTTHLVADVGAHSAKVKCALRLGLPIVSPKWVMDSADRGRLLPIDEYTHDPSATDENASPQEASPEEHEPFCAFVQEPLNLLREAASAGELASALPPATTSTVNLCGHRYHLDTPTGMRKLQAHTPATIDDNASGNGALPQPPAPRAYTLRELLFAVHCASLSHADCPLAGLNALLHSERSDAVGAAQISWRASGSSVSRCCCSTRSCCSRRPCA
jgi:hypothetical protein